MEENFTPRWQPPPQSLTATPSPFIIPAVDPNPAEVRLPTEAQFKLHFIQTMTNPIKSTPTLPTPPPLGLLMDKNGDQATPYCPFRWRFLKLYVYATKPAQNPVNLPIRFALLWLLATLFATTLASTDVGVRDRWGTAVWSVDTVGFEPLTLTLGVIHSLLSRPISLIPSLESPHPP
ncbi:hypothetical protein BD410DRAFT_840288 [Rickenella mellea]|uniref:Uncharacterized protein n=1 Tax=Rickenella mellea TaxID=50990 RepID=A0A4Y7Q4Z9_9AGAM|nr:hypothetical protein BD410DRAFT_840288 [Rickenella mellea]